MTLSFTAPPTWWRFLMVSSMRLCQPAERHRLHTLESSSRHPDSNRKTLWRRGNSPTTGSFLKGILDRDSFSISRHTAKSHVDETTASLISVNICKDQNSARFGTYLPASSALRLNPCKESPWVRKQFLFTSLKYKTFFFLFAYLYCFLSWS